MKKETKKWDDGDSPHLGELGQRGRLDADVDILAKPTFNEQLGDLLLGFSQLAQHGHLGSHAALSLLGNAGDGHGA